MKLVALSEVCEIVNGGTPKTGVEDYWDGDILWITPKDLGKEINKSTEYTKRTLTQAGIDGSSAKVIPANSVVLSTRAPIGYLVINSKPMSFNQGCKGLIPKSNLDVNYLYYFLRHSKQRLNDLGTGTTFPELSNKALSSVTLPLPPIEQQRLIVVKLDAAFERIDRALELTQKNVKASEKLFEDELSVIFRRNNEGWATGRLDSFCVLQRGHDLPKSARKPGVYKLASSSGIIDTHNTFKSKGPGVFTGRSGSIGGVFYEEGDYWPLNTVLYVKEFYDNEPKLIYYLIKSLDFKKYAGGTGVPTLNRNNVHSIVVSLPSVTGQQALINKLDHLFGASCNLIELYKNKISHLRSLKQSMLNESFLESDVK